MATFTVLAKFIPLNISVIQRHLGLAKFLSSKNFQLYGICDKFSFHSTNSQRSPAGQMFRKVRAAPGGWSRDRRQC